MPSVGNSKTREYPDHCCERPGCGQVVSQFSKWWFASDYVANSTEKKVLCHECVCMGYRLTRDALGKVVLTDERFGKYALDDARARDRARDFLREMRS
jgi:hypothetical protein